MKVIVIHSGGLDSSVLVAHHQALSHAVTALSINYGQRHAVELSYARRFCEQLKVPHVEADLTGLRQLMLGSSQTDSSVPVPHGHYAEESMKQTVVPNRNMLLLAAAGALAISLKADFISYAAHAGDHAIYPDCRPEFAVAMQHALSLADWHPVRLERPFIDRTKADIVRLGAVLRVPFDATWSCYEGNPAGHCGKCGTCVERLEAFALAGMVDPAHYLDHAHNH